MDRFVYPATLTPDPKDGGFVVTFADVSEAITQGEDRADARREAADCLEEAIANRMVMGLPLPSPSPVKKRQSAVPLPAQTAAKAALYFALQEAKITKANKPKTMVSEKRPSDDA